MTVSQFPRLKINVSRWRGWRQCSRNKQLQNKPPLPFTAEKDKVLSRVAKFTDVVSTVLCCVVQCFGIKPRCYQVEYIALFQNKTVIKMGKHVLVSVTLNYQIKLNVDINCVVVDYYITDHDFDHYSNIKPNHTICPNISFFSPNQDILIQILWNSLKDFTSKTVKYVLTFWFIYDNKQLCFWFWTV